MITHNTRASQLVGVTLTVVIEVFFSFLAGWAMYDEFRAWAWIAGIIIGGLAGLVFLLLGLYVFILREYAIDANKLFAKMRGENPGTRIAWAVFLVCLVVAVESFINANRMSVLPVADTGAKVFLWLCFQCLVFVPLALGKLVHGHVNATDPQVEEQKFYNSIDTAFYQKVQQQVPGMSLSELAALRQGRTDPLTARMQQEQQQIEAANQEEAPHPLADGLRTLDTTPIQAIERNTNGHRKQLS